MLENIIVCCFLAIVPILLWSIPQTRKITTTWITAFKTVPIGCLATFWVPISVYALVRVLNSHYGWFPHYTRFGYFSIVILVLGLVLGIWLIIFLARLSWRKYSAVGKRHSWLPFAAVFIFFAGATLVISIAYSIILYSGNATGYRRDWTTFWLPEENHTMIGFEQCPIHPFLAEYDYRLCFRCGDKTEYRNLHTNCGGRTCFNIFRLKDGRLFFTDKDCDYIVDVKKTEIFHVFNHEGKYYAALYPQDKVRSWGYGWDGNRMIYHHNGQETEAFPLSSELEGKIYYGCITDDFYSAAEKSEQTIDK